METKTVLPGLPAQQPQIQKLEGGQRALQIWPVPTDEAFLEGFLTYVFET